MWSRCACKQFERLRINAELRCAEVWAEILVKFSIQMLCDLGNERKGDAFGVAANNDICVPWRRTEDAAQARGRSDLRVERHRTNERYSGNHSNGCHNEQAPRLAQPPERQCYGRGDQGPATLGQAGALELRF